MHLQKKTFSLKHERALNNQPVSDIFARFRVLQRDEPIITYRKMEETAVDLEHECRKK